MRCGKCQARERKRVTIYTRASCCTERDWSEASARDVCTFCPSISSKRIQQVESVHISFLSPFFLFFYCNTIFSFEFFFLFSFLFHSIFAQRMPRHLDQSRHAFFSLNLRNSVSLFVYRYHRLYIILIQEVIIAIVMIKNEIDIRPRPFQSIPITINILR